MVCNDDSAFLFASIAVLLDMSDGDFGRTPFEFILISFYHDVNVLVVRTALDAVVFSDSAAMLAYSADWLQLTNV